MNPLLFLAMNQASSLTDLLRHRVRTLRDERGETRDELARRARSHGLPWSRDTIAHIEDGTRAIPVEEFLLLPFIFECELADILGPGDADDVGGVVLVIDARARILLTEQASAQPRALAAVLRGRWSDHRDGFETPGSLDAIAERMAGTIGRFADTTARLIERRTKSYERLWPGASVEELIQAEAAAENLAEQKAEAKLGVDALYVSVAAFGLWGRSLTDERDRRLIERAKASISPRSRQALRGHITRELLQELEPVIRRYRRRARR